MIKKLLKLWKHRQTLRHFLSTQLSLLEKDGVADALGGLTEEETAGLVRWVKSVPKNSVVIEFGTLFGLTSQS